MTVQDAGFYPDMTTDFEGSQVSQIQAYTTIAAPPEPGKPAATLASTLPVNFSGQTQAGSPSTFTVAGWLRVDSFPSDQPTMIFSAPDQFTMSLTSKGSVTATFGMDGSPPSVESQMDISDNEWHYVAVACAQTSDTEPTVTVLIVIDGLVVADMSVPAGNASATASPCVIGGPGLQFISWEVWSVMLIIDELCRLEFGPPAPQSVPDLNLLAAFDFANGAMQDVSGNNVAVSVTPGPSFAPRLSLSEGSALTPAPADRVIAFGDADFTWMGWVVLPKQVGVQLSLFETSDQFGFASITVSDTGEDGKLWYLLGLQTVARFEAVPGSLVHVTLTTSVSDGGTHWDGWINGSHIGSGGYSMIVPAGPAQLVLAGSPCAVHGVSIWNRALTQSEIAADIAGSDPTGTDGLLAYYALQHDLKNSVTDKAATVVNAELVDIVEDETLAGQISQSLAAPRPAVDLGTLVDLRDTVPLAAAVAHGIDVTSPGDASALSKQQAALFAWFEEQLDGLPSVTADHARSQFLRNLRIGDELRAAGVRQGEFEVAVEGDHTVVFFHDADGRHEIHRFDEVLDPTTEWVIKIIVDVIKVIGALFGIITPAGKLSNVLKVIAIVLPTIQNALLDAFKANDPAAACVAVLREIYTAGIALTVIKGLVTGSWWSFIFTVLSVLGQVVAIILSEGAALFVRIGLAAISVTKLTTDLVDGPGSAIDLRERLAIEDGSG